MRTSLVVAFAVAACSSPPGTPDVHYLAWGTSDRTVTVAVVAPDGAMAITIERGSSKADLAPIATLAPEETSFLDTGLAAQTTYTYRVSYTLADGTTLVDDTEEATTTDEEPLLGGAPVPVGAPVITTVGAAGAAIEVPAAHATVIVPPGAVADGTEVTVQPIASPYADDTSPAVAIAASHPIALPVQLVFALGDADLPDGMAIATQADDGMWVSQPLVIDEVAHTMAISLAPPHTRDAQWTMHGAILLRETAVIAHKDRLRVRESTELEAFGRFSDWPFHGGPDDQALAAFWGAVLAGTKQLDLHDFKRPAHLVVLHLANDAPGWERFWTADHVPNGNAAVGTIVPGPVTGATYTAPAAAPTAPPNPGAVAIQFVSKNLTTGRTAYAKPEFINIHDPGSYTVTAKFHATHTNIPCPAAFFDVDDEISFAITLDAQLNYHVESIVNHPTKLSNPEVMQGFAVSFDQDPDVLTLSDATTITDNADTGSLGVSMRGMQVPGTCAVYSGGTLVGHLPGGTFDASTNFTIYSDLRTHSESSYWSFTVTESPK